MAYTKALEYFNRMNSDKYKEMPTLEETECLSRLNIPNKIPVYSGHGISKAKKDGEDFIKSVVDHYEIKRADIDDKAIVKSVREISETIREDLALAIKAEDALHAMLRITKEENIKLKASNKTIQEERDHYKINAEKSAKDADTNLMIMMQTLLLWVFINALIYFIRVT